MIPILTFFDPSIPGHVANDLLPLFIHAWSKRGFTVHTVSPHWIDLHPASPHLRKFWETAPSLTSKPFESICALRWPAFAAFMSHHSIPAAALLDCDIAPLLTPLNTFDLALQPLPSSASLAGGGFVVAHAPAAHRIASSLLNALIASTSFFDGYPHVSDNLALHHLPFLLPPPNSPITQSFIPNSSPLLSIPTVHVHQLYNLPYDRPAAFRYVISLDATSFPTATS